MQAAANDEMKLQQEIRTLLLHLEFEAAYALAEERNLPALAFEAALSMNDRIKCENVLSKVLDRSEQESLYRTALLKRNPTWIGKTALLLGLYAEALSAFEEAGLFVEAARAAEVQGEFEIAEDHWKKAAEDDFSIRNQLHVAEFFLRASRFREALHVLIGLHSKVRPHSKATEAEADKIALLCARTFKTLGMEEAARIWWTRIQDIEATGAFDELVPFEKTRTDLVYARYEIFEEVGSGATARVHRAFDSLTQQMVAFKMFAMPEGERTRDALSRFCREARVLSQLLSSHVVRVVDVQESGPTIVLEWMGGGTWRDRLRKGDLNATEICAAFDSLFSALAAASSVGILHRDIKPENMLRDSFGKVKLSDFGAAHLGGAQVTLTDARIGSLSYMAPELARAGGEANIRSDLYSAASALFESYFGQSPNELSPERREAQEWQDWLPAEWTDFFAKALSFEPEERFASAEEARAAFLALPHHKLSQDRFPLALWMSKDPVLASPTVSTYIEPRFALALPNGALLRDRDLWLNRAVIRAPKSMQVEIPSETLPDQILIYSEDSEQWVFEDVQAVEIDAEQKSARAKTERGWVGLPPQLAEQLKTIL